MNLKLYIWDDFYPYDTKAIVAVAIASSLDEAKALVEENHGWPYKLKNWGDYYTVPLNSPFAISVVGGG
jgi:hypothetical protein